MQRAGSRSQAREATLTALCDIPARKLVLINLLALPWSSTLPTRLTRLMVALATFKRRTVSAYQLNPVLKLRKYRAVVTIVERSSFDLFHVAKNRCDIDGKYKLDA